MSLGGHDSDAVKLSTVKAVDVQDKGTMLLFAGKRLKMDPTVERAEYLVRVGFRGDTISWNDHQLMIVK